MTVRLSLAERTEVACYHPFVDNRPQWELDSNTSHMVHSACGKPAPDLVLRICSECGKEFVMNFGPDWVSKFFVTKNGEVFEREFFCPPCY
jgi:hypothetical protein